MTTDNQPNKPFVILVIQFLLKRYDFRYNEVTGYIEFRKKGISEIKIDRKSVV